MSTNHALLEILASLWHGSCGLVMFHCFVKVWQVQHRMDLINYSEHVNSTEYIYIYIYNASFAYDHFNSFQYFNNIQFILRMLNCLYVHAVSIYKYIVFIFLVSILFWYLSSLPSRKIEIFLKMPCF